MFGLCSHLPPQPTDSSPKRPPATCILHATSLLPCGSCVSLVSRSRVQLTAKSAQWLWRQEIVPTRFGWDRVFRPLLYTRSQSIGVHQGRFPGAALALHDAETASCPICVAGHSSATSPKHPVIQTPKTCFPYWNSFRSWILSRPTSTKVRRWPRNFFRKFLEWNRFL